MTVPVQLSLFSWSHLLLLSHFPLVPTYFATSTKNTTFYPGALVVCYSVTSPTSLKFGLTFSEYKSRQSANTVFARRQTGLTSTLDVVSTTPCASPCQSWRRTSTFSRGHLVSNFLLLAETRPRLLSDGCLPSSMRQCVSTPMRSPAN